MSENLYTWKFPWRKNHSGMWYIVALSLVIGIVLWGFITRQYGLSLVLLLASWIFFYVENNSEDEVFVTINGYGIQIWGSFYDFSKIDQYAFITNSNQIILIRFYINKSRTSRFLDIELNDKIAADLQTILPNFLPEWQRQELGLTDKLIRLFNL